jgi:predicted DNA-binding protein (UPF0251 family)
VATSTSEPAAPDEELQALHEEIARLPEKFRRAVILCDLQSVPQIRAAGELRLSERTLQRRLSQGRERLKARLIRRGLAPAGGMLSAIFLREARSAAPAAWNEATVRAALSAVNHGFTVGVDSASAKELTQEVLKVMSPPARAPDQLHRPRSDRSGQGCRIGEMRCDARPGLDIHGHRTRSGQ